eukprot:12798788-Alexandrium_andersonii.AAC.1
MKCPRPARSEREDAGRNCRSRALTGRAGALPATALLLRSERKRGSDRQADSAQNSIVPER